MGQTGASAGVTAWDDSKPWWVARRGAHAAPRPNPAHSPGGLPPMAGGLTSKVPPTPPRPPLCPALGPPGDSRRALAVGAVGAQLRPVAARVHVQLKHTVGGGGVVRWGRGALGWCGWEGGGRLRGWEPGSACCGARCRRRAQLRRRTLQLPPRATIAACRAPAAAHLCAKGHAAARAQRPLRRTSGQITAMCACVRGSRRAAFSPGCAKGHCAGGGAEGGGRGQRVAGGGWRSWLCARSACGARLASATRARPPPSRPGRAPAASHAPPIAWDGSRAGQEEGGGGQAGEDGRASRVAARELTQAAHPAGAHRQCHCRPSPRGRSHSVVTMRPPASRVRGVRSHGGAHGGDATRPHHAEFRSCSLHVTDNIRNTHTARGGLQTPTPLPAAVSERGTPPCAHLVGAGFYLWDEARV